MATQVEIEEDDSTLSRSADRASHECIVAQRSLR